MNGLGGVTKETLDLIRAAQTPRGDLEKAWTQSNPGLVNINLERPAKLIYPVLTPLRNMIPRVGTRNGGTAVQWRAITGINTGLVSAGVPEAARGGVIATTLKNYIAGFKTIGLEDNVSDEADLAAEGFDDARARMIEGLLRSTMIEEENIMMGGNNSKQFGTAVAPTTTTSTSGGSIGAGVTVVVSVVYLTHEGWRRSTVAGGVPGQVTITPPVGSAFSFGGFNSQISTGTSQVTGAGSTNSVTATTTAFAPAMAYAWYWGATAGAAQKLGAITTVNTVVITTAAGTGTQAANDAAVAADYSTNAYIYDGLLSIIAGAGQENPAASSSGSLVAIQSTTAGTGTPLTSDNAGGIVEIDQDFLSFWNNYRLNPTHIFMNAQELLNITKKIVAGGSAPLFRFALDAATTTPGALQVHAGTVVAYYLCKYAMGGPQSVKIVLHPTLAPGTIVYYAERIPYPLSNVGNPLQLLTRKDYYQTDWPRRLRMYEAGVYCDGVLQCYFPPAFGMRTNIGNG